MPDEVMEPLRNDPTSTQHEEMVTWLASEDRPHPLTTMERARQEREMRRSSAAPRPELLENVRHVIQLRARGFYGDFDQVLEELCCRCVGVVL